MNVTNVSSEYLFLGDVAYGVAPGATIAVPDAVYNSNNAVAQAINNLDTLDKVTVASPPAGYPRSVSSGGGGSDVQNLYDANTVLAANVDNTPAAITMGASTILARLASGSIKAASVSEIQALLTIPTSLRKTTTKTVVSSVTETDLLNGEITIPANAMGANGIVKLKMYGTLFNNRGSDTGFPRLRLKHGGTTFFDISPAGNILGNNTATNGWWLELMIANAGATNSQNYGWMFGMDLIGVGGGGGLFNAGLGTWLNSAPSGGVGWFSATGANTGSKDTSSAQTIEFTTVLPVSDANVNMKLNNAIAEIFPT